MSHVRDDGHLKRGNSGWLGFYNMEWMQPLRRWLFVRPQVLLVRGKVVLLVLHSHLS